GVARRASGGSGGLSADATGDYATGAAGSDYATACRDAACRASGGSSGLPADTTGDYAATAAAASGHATAFRHAARRARVGASHHVGATAALDWPDSDCDGCENGGRKSTTRR